MRARFIVPVTVWVMLAGLPAHAEPSLKLTRTFVTDGGVGAFASDGSTLYLGGAFDYIGQRSGGFVLLSQSGVRDKSVPEVGGGQVQAITPDGSGGYFVAGDLRSAGSIRLRGLAHLRADNTWDPAFHAAFNKPVYAVAVDATHVYVGGAFTTVNGVARPYFAVFDRSTGALTSLDLEVNKIVRSLVVSDSALFIGGDFTTIGGVARSRLARLDLPAASVSAWNPAPNDQVVSLALAGTTLYAAGNFTQVGSTARTYVAAIDTSSGSVRSFSTSPDAGVFVVAVQNNMLYMAGAFSSVGGVPHPYFAAVDATTGAVLPFRADTSGYVDAILPTPNAVYVGGVFTLINGYTRKYLASVDPTTGTVQAWNPHASGIALALASHPSGVLAGGAFASVNGQDRSNLAAIDLATGRATNWKPVAHGEVSALLLVGSTVYIAGGYNGFNTINGQPRRGLAAVTTSGTLLPLRADADAQGIDQLAIRGNTLYLAGGFQTISGTTRDGVAAVDATTGALTDWDPGAFPGVSALEVINSVIYLGGPFQFARRYFEGLDATTGSAVTPEQNPDYELFTLHADGTLLYVGGLFSTFGGMTRHGIACFDTATNTVTSWAPPLPANAQEHAIATSASTVYTVEGLAYLGHVVWAFDKATGAIDSFNPKFVNGGAQALAVIGNRLVIGGHWDGIDGVSQTGFAVYTGTP